MFLDLVLECWQSFLFHFLNFLTATTSLVMFWLCSTGNPVAVHSPLSKEPPLGGAGTLRAAYSMERLATSPSSATEESGVSWLIAGLVDWLAGHLVGVWAGESLFWVLGQFFCVCLLDAWGLLLSQFAGFRVLSPWLDSWWICLFLTLFAPGFIRDILIGWSWSGDQRPATISLCLVFILFPACWYFNFLPRTPCCGGCLKLTRDIHFGNCLLWRLSKANQRHLFWELSIVEAI